MNILKHPLLRAVSSLIEQERTVFKWIDLYAAQFISDAFCEPELEPECVTENSKHQSGMSDLFDDMADTTITLNKADVIVLALMCSQLVSQGKTYLDLTHLPYELMASAKACGYRPSFQSSTELLEGLHRLAQKDLLRIVASPINQADQGIPLDDASLSQQTPLILYQHKLYLAKYWSLHQAFELWLQARKNHVELLDTDVLTALSNLLKKVFPKEEGSHAHYEDHVNWQAVSAAHTLLNPFSLITGGPGTGKTTTAASLLFLLMEKRRLQASTPQKLHLRLLAPTGKAAVKLADSIRHQLRQIEDRVLGNNLTRLRMSDCLPETGETVHRFLYEMGGLRDSFQRPKGFKSDEVLIKRSEQQNQQSTLNDRSSCGKTPEKPFEKLFEKPLDVVIVDESSMMDLALMVELVSLMPANTQLILLGDHFQLPAVDPGQVFTECVARFSIQRQTPEELASLAALTGYQKDQLTQFDVAHANRSDLGFQPLCTLRKTFRFGGELKVAADQIKLGDVDAFMRSFWCASDDFKPGSTVTWYDEELNETIDYVSMVNAYRQYFDLVAKQAPLTELSEQFECFQLLCSTLEGPLGVHYINTFIEQRFHEACFPQGKIMGELYHGKAILVTRNHPHLGIYNGDIGFVIKDDRTRNLNVHFPVTNQAPIIVPPARIKQWQSAYAMTVHKSQGSEYHHVGIILADYAKELLSRALLYTALTRSKTRCDVWVGREALHKAFQE